MVNKISRWLIHNLICGFLPFVPPSGRYRTPFLYINISRWDTKYNSTLEGFQLSTNHKSPLFNPWLRSDQLSTSLHCTNIISWVRIISQSAVIDLSTINLLTLQNKGSVLFILLLSYTPLLLHPSPAPVLEMLPQILHVVLHQFLVRLWKKTQQ